MKSNSIILIFLIILSCGKPNVETGLDRISQFHNLFEDKRVGIITNHTARDAGNRHITDIFLELEGVKVTALFGPEHGVRGHVEAGAHVESETGTDDRIPIFSLYGKTRKPTPGMLANVDVLVFDIQDIGTRYYTYIYTMALAMEAAAEHGKSFIVLDRPNPINGVDVEGNVLNPDFNSFVGLYPIPVRHGMTVGELARLFNEEGWLANSIKANLTVVPIQNWNRADWHDQTGLNFIKPSPNMPTVTTATTYPGICLLEGVNMAEGRGTSTPFEIFGAPWIDSNLLTGKLNALQLPGVVFRDTTFTPISIPGASANPKYKDVACNGSAITVSDRSKLQPYWMGVQLVSLIHEMYPDSLTWRSSFFDKLTGTSKIRETIIENGDINKLPVKWQLQLDEFLAKREKYLLYE